MATVFLKVALDVTKQRDIAYSSKDQETKGSEKNENSEENRDEEELGD